MQFLYILSNTYFPHFLNCSHPCGRKVQLTVVLIYISLMINDVEHLFMCLLGICLSSLEKGLFKSLPIFNWAINLFTTEFKSSSYVLDTSPFCGLQIYPNISFHSANCLFPFSVMFHAE